MVDRTPIVVFGEVLSTRPGPYENSPTTDSLLAIEEVLKGFVAGSGIMIRQPGGVGADEAVATVVGLPMLAEGDRVLLFLREEEEGAHRIVDYALGMFFEARVGDRLLLLRVPSLQGEVVLPGGLTGSDRVRSRGYRDAEDFRRWIANGAAGSERPSDYLLPKLWDGPVAVASPYRLRQAECRTNPNFRPETHSIRWRNFERGESVDFQVHSRGQPGIQGGGLSQVRAAMRLWNEGLGKQRQSAFRRDRLQGTGLRPARRAQLSHVRGSVQRGAGVGHSGPGGTNRRGSGQDCLPSGEQYTRTPRLGRLWRQMSRTQDGFQNYLRDVEDSKGSRIAELSFQNTITHELGHALGLAHPCETEEFGCTDRHSAWGAIMWPVDDLDRSLGTGLHSDDRNAVRRLYPPGTVSLAPDLGRRVPTIDGEFRRGRRYLHIQRDGAQPR